ncbi:hypothetical protein Tco_1414218, partial [Tanacetum coccineum]
EVEGGCYPGVIQGVTGYSSIDFSMFSIDFSISFSNKDSFSYKLIPVSNVEPEPVDEHAEINTESCSENIDVKPMESVTCINKDIIPIDFNENLETNHDDISKPSKANNFILIIDLISRMSFHEGKPLIFVIKNLYVSFGIPFDPKRFYKDGAYMKKLRRPRMLMEHRDAQDQSVFTSRAWRRLFEVRGPLFQLGKAKRRISWREFILTMGLHTAGEIRPARFRTCWAESARQIPDKGDQSAPEKVTVTNLFYLIGMDVDSFNIPYLLARYLRRFASWRKQGAIIYREIVQDLPVIDIVELPDATTGALEVVEGAPDVNEGAQAVPAPVQAPQPPHAAQGRTMPQRIARLEEEVHDLRGSMAE